MPFKSFRQQHYMFKFHPEIAKRWAKKYGTKKKPKGYKSGKKKALAKYLKRTLRLKGRK